jgi:uridine kinase
MTHRHHHQHHQPRQPLFIVLTGPVACGKSTIAKYFFDTWPDVVEVVQADNYYLDRSYLPVEERSEAFINYDVPDAIDFELLRNNLERLRRGEVVGDAPLYDFTTHTSTRTVCLKPKRVVFVDGHQVLHGIPRSRFPWDLCVYVDTPLELCFERRLLRDSDSRTKRSFLEIAEQHILKTLPAHRTFGAPQADDCDLVLADVDVIQQTLFLFILSHHAFLTSSR